MRRSNTVPLGRSYLALAALAAGAGLMTACDREPEEEQVYCADENGVIVDEDLCEDDGDGHHGRFFLWVGPHGRGLRPGQTISGGKRLLPSDSTGRTRYGLPSVGRISNGTVVSGGFGGSGSGGS